MTSKLLLICSCGLERESKATFYCASCSKLHCNACAPSRLSFLRCPQCSFHQQATKSGNVQYCKKCYHCPRCESGYMSIKTQKDGVCWLACPECGCDSRELPAPVTGGTPWELRDGVEALIAASTVPREAEIVRCGKASVDSLNWQHTPVEPEAIPTKGHVELPGLIRLVPLRSFTCPVVGHTIDGVAVNTGMSSSALFRHDPDCRAASRLPLLTLESEARSSVSFTVTNPLPATLSVRVLDANNSRRSVTVTVPVNAAPVKVDVPLEPGPRMQGVVRAQSRAEPGLLSPGGSRVDRVEVAVEYSFVVYSGRYKVS